MMRFKEFENLKFDMMQEECYEEAEENSQMAE